MRNAYESPDAEAEPRAHQLCLCLLRQHRRHGCRRAVLQPCGGLQERFCNPACRQAAWRRRKPASARQRRSSAREGGHVGWSKTVARTRGRPRVACQVARALAGPLDNRTATTGTACPCTCPLSTGTVSVIAGMCTKARESSSITWSSLRSASISGYTAMPTLPVHSCILSTGDLPSSRASRSLSLSSRVSSTQSLISANSCSISALLSSSA